MQVNEIFERLDALVVAVRTWRDRVAKRLAGHSAYVAATGVLVAGFGLAGTSAATAPAGTPVGPDAVVEDPGALEAGRAEAAQRPERAVREDEPPPPPVEPPDWVHPMPGAKITSSYGPRWGLMHAGMDFGAPENAPIFAVGAGTVLATGWVYAGYGISVLIDHGDGYLTHYAHLNKANVAVGDRVGPGDLIGWEGSTGDSTGPHLHFEVHRGLWNQIDPVPWLRERGVDLG